MFTIAVHIEAGEGTDDSRERQDHSNAFFQNIFYTKSFSLFMLKLFNQKRFFAKPETADTTSKKHKNVRIEEDIELSLTSLTLISGSHHLRLSNHNNNNYLKGHQNSLQQQHQQPQKRAFYYTKARHSGRNNNKSSAAAGAAATRLDHDATVLPPQQPPRARGMGRTVSGSSSEGSDESMDLMELYRHEPRRGGRRPVHPRQQEQLQTVRTGGSSLNRNDHDSYSGSGSGSACYQSPAHTAATVRAADGTQEKAYTTMALHTDPGNHPHTMDCHNMGINISSLTFLSTNVAAVAHLQQKQPQQQNHSTAGNSGIDHTTSTLTMDDDFSQCSASEKDDDDGNDNTGDPPKEKWIPRPVLAADDTEAHDEFGGDNDDENEDEAHAHHQQQHPATHDPTGHPPASLMGNSLPAPSNTTVPPSCSTSSSLRLSPRFKFHLNAAIGTKDGNRRTNDQQMFFL